MLGQRPWLMVCCALKLRLKGGLQSRFASQVLMGVQGLYKQMVDSFRSLGVEAVPGVGHPFDPNFHEAIVSETNDDVPDGTVLQEFRKGFQCGDRLLRPAMVKVSRKHP